MKPINRKITISILICALLLLFSTIAYAKPFTDAFRGGLLQINDFFTREQYKAYSQAIDFFFFALLFISVYMIGVRYAFKEAKRPEKVIAILLGLMTAFLLVLGGFSATILIPYLQYLLYTLVFIMWWLLLKGIKNKFWRFVLALLLTLLTIGAFQWLFGGLTAPDTEGFFKSFLGSFKAIQLPEISGWPGVPDLSNLFGAAPAPVTTPTPVTATPTPTPGPVPGAAPPEDKGWPWWVWLLPLLLIPLFFLGKKFWPESAPSAAPAQPATPAAPTTPKEVAEETIDELIKEVTDAINKKRGALEKIKEIIRRKEKGQKEIEGFLDLYHKKIYDDAFYLDRDSQAYKDLMAEHKAVTELIEIELDLEKDLLELMKLEEELIGKSQLPLGNWDREKFSGRLVEALSIPKQKEWYGRVFIWYWYVKRLQKYIESEYTSRLLLPDEPQREELAVPKGIADFFGRIFGGMDAAFGELRANNQSLLSRIKSQIIRYYVWTKDERRIATEIGLLSDAKKLEQWLKKGWATRWHDIKEQRGKELVAIFENEKKMFLGNQTFDAMTKTFNRSEYGLFRNLLRQLALLQYIKAALEALKRLKASMTQLQDLYVSRKDDIAPHAGTPGTTKWTEMTREEEEQPFGIVYSVHIDYSPVYSVHTRIQEGIGPFLVRCYVNKKLVTIQNRKADGTPIRADWYKRDAATGAVLKDAADKPIADLDAMIPMTKRVEKKHDEVRFSFEEIGINAPGVYEVKFVCISVAGLNAESKPIPGQTVYERKDSKTITIYLGGHPHALTPPHAATPPHAETPEELVIRINSPPRDSNYNIGETINGLNAEVIRGPRKDEINAESIPNIKFVWYVEQLEGWEISDAKPIQRIHIGRRGDSLALDGGIFKFAPDQDSMEVKLIVFLIDTGEGRIVAADTRTIILKPATMPHVGIPHGTTPEEIIKIRIRSPTLGASFRIGEFIDTLEAEMEEGPQKDDINAERIPNIKFVWYVEQLEGWEISDAKPIQRIHIGRTTPLTTDSEAISSHYNFRPGPANLIVFLIDTDEKRIIAAAQIPITLEPLFVPHAGTPMPHAHGPHTLTPPIPSRAGSRGAATGTPSTTLGGTSGMVVDIDRMLTGGRSGAGTARRRRRKRRR